MTRVKWFLPTSMQRQMFPIKRLYNLPTRNPEEEHVLLRLIDERQEKVNVREILRAVVPIKYLSTLFHVTPYSY